MSDLLGFNLKLWKGSWESLIILIFINRTNQKQTQLKPTQTNQSTQNSQNQPRLTGSQQFLASFFSISAKKFSTHVVRPFWFSDLVVFLAFFSLHSRHLPFWSFISTSPPSLTAFIVLFPPQCSSLCFFPRVYLSDCISSKEPFPSNSFFTFCRKPLHFQKSVSTHFLRLFWCL